MITPPRTAELFLDALAEETAFREDLVGDFAEEFADRARRDGTRAARFWYYRELLRTTPHVLSNWVSGLKASDAVRLVSIAFSSLTFLLVLDLLPAVMIVSIARTFGFAHGFPIGAPRSITRLLIEMAIAIPNAALGGVIAAYLGDRTPLLSGLALGVVWAGTAFLVRFIVALSGHGAFGLATIGMAGISGILILGSTVLGAMFRVRVKRPRATAGS